MTDPELNAEFGRRLREVREQVSMTQEALASASTLSRTSIVNIERGRQGISLETLYRLARALGRDPDDLLPEPPARRPAPLIRIGPRTPESERAVMAVIRRIESEAEA